MAIDICRANTRSRSIVSTSISVVADHGNDDPSIAGLVNHILEVFSIRELLAAAGATVFVFRLVEDDRSTIGDLSFGDSSSHIGNVTDIISVDRFCSRMYHTYQ